MKRIILIIQIVCPSCYEPIFKVNRNDEDNEIHYLAHYKGTKTKEESSLCELRVSKISQKEYEQKKAEGREQRLVFFLDVFRVMVLSTVDIKDKTMPIENMKRIKKSKGYKVLESGFIEGLIDDVRENPYADTEFFKGVVRINTKRNKINKPILSSFTSEKQIDIAVDLYRYLLSPKGVTNLKYLLRLSFHDCFVFYEKNRKYKALVPLMGALIESSKNQSDAILQNMSNAAFDDNFSQLHTLTNSLYSFMIERLIELPYFEQLKGIESNKQIH